MTEPRRRATINATPTKEKRENFDPREYGLLQYDKKTVSEDEYMKQLRRLDAGLPWIMQFLGFAELHFLSLYKSALVEFVGSAVMCFVHIGIVYASLNYSYPPAPIGFLHALLITFFIFEFAHTSGGHFNAMISMTFCATGHMKFVRTCLYILVQFLGWMAGAAMARRVVGDEWVIKYGLGGCSYYGMDFAQAFILEYMIDLCIIFPIYGCVLNKRQGEIFGFIIGPSIIGITLGLLIFASAGMGAPPFTGASMNPTMCSGINIQWAKGVEQYYANANANDNVYDDDMADYTRLKESVIYTQFGAYWVAPIVAVISHAVFYYVAPPFHDQALAPPSEETEEIGNNTNAPALTENPVRSNAL